MKRILILSVLLSGALMLTSCGNRNTSKQNQTEQTEEVAVAEVDDILNQASELAGKEVEVEGICTHICKHGGRKVFLMGSSDKVMIRVEAGEKIGAFAPECVNNLVRIKGILVEDRIDEAYLAHWEEQLKNQTAEKHGEGEGGCSTEKQARGEQNVTTNDDRIKAFRERIAERKAKEGKEYLSFYHIDGLSYEVVK